MKLFARFTNINQRKKQMHMLWSLKVEQSILILNTKHAKEEYEIIMVIPNAKQNLR